MRAYGWLGVVLSGLLTLGILGGLHGIELESNILELLPEAHRDKDLEAAVEAFGDLVSRKVIFLVGSEDREMAYQQTKQFAQKLGNDDVYERVTYDTRKTYDGLRKLYQPYASRLLDSKTSPDSVPPKSLLLDSEDPLFLTSRFLSSVLRQRGQLQREKDILMLEHEGTFYGFVSASLRESPFRIPVQNRVLMGVEKLQAEFPNTSIVFHGIVRFAESGARRMLEEGRLFGGLSLLGVSLLLFLAFRSLVVFALAALPLCVGFLLATAMTLICFGEVHLATLVFGCSLLGVSVDYVFHFLCEKSLFPDDTAEEVIRGIRFAMGLSLLTSCIGYLGLGFPPFPGLRQMALFSVVGLSSAYFTIIFWFPYLSPGVRSLEHSSLAKVVASYLQFSTTPLGHIWFGFLALFSIVMGAYGVSSLETDDDVRNLQEPPQEILEIARWVTGLTGGFDPFQFLFVPSKSTEELLQEQEKLATSLDSLVQRGDLGSYQMLAQFVPSQAKQRASQNIVSKIAPSQAYQQESGMLMVEDWSNSSATADYQHLAKSGLILLQGIRNEKALKELPGAEFVRRVDSVNAVLKHYRIEATRMTIAAASLIVLALILVYRGRYGVLVVCAPFCSVLFALGSLGFRGTALTIFHIMALLLLLGIAIDYSVFYCHHLRLLKSQSLQATLVAISLAAFTTLLSFGLLSLSETVVLRAFGEVLTPGVLMALMLAPLPGILRKSS